MKTIAILVRLPRIARGAILAAGLALVVAAPAAAAAPASAATPPTRSTWTPGGFVMQPGQGCSFAVRGVPTSGFSAETDFSANHWMRSIHVKGYYENLDTGARYWVNDSWSEDDVYDPVANVLVVKTNGQVDVPFWPGDTDPFGELVGYPGSFYRFQGTSVNTVDFNGTPRTASFTWSGKITDICAALS